MSVTRPDVSGRLAFQTSPLSSVVAASGSKEKVKEIELPANRFMSFKIALHTSMQSMKPVAYEILRKEAGAVALSVNAGLLNFEPFKCWLNQDVLVVANEMGTSAVTLLQLPADVVTYMQENSNLPFFEFATFGVFKSCDLIILQPESLT